MATLGFPANTGTAAVTSTQTATVVVQTNSDPDAEDEKVELGYELGSVTGPGGALLNAATSGTALADANLAINTAADSLPGSFKIVDDETQTYVLAVTSPAAPAKPREGQPVELSLQARPVHVDGSERLTVSIDKPPPSYGFTIAGGASLSATQTTIGVDNVATTTVDESKATITITSPTNDGNREDDTVTVSVYSGNAARSALEASMAIKLADANALPAIGAMVTDKDGKPITPQPTSVEEGDSIYVMVMPVDKDGDATPAAEKLTVGLTSSGTAGAATSR